MGSLSTARGLASPAAIACHWKAILSAVLVLGVVADIGVHAAAVVTSPSTDGKADRGLDSTRSIEMEADDGYQIDNIRNRRFFNKKPPPVKDSCYSTVLNDTLPAAHIKGRGIMWKETNDDSYIPQWNCESESLHTSAFVSGGMWFHHDDNSLYVPTCGWYYVSSKITFQSNNTNARNYSHTLKIERNCNSSSNVYSQSSSTTIGPLEAGSHAKSSTFVGDIVKICTGGRIYVHIPLNYNSCCPLGDESRTLLAAHLVRETDCEWPVPSFNEPQESFQERQQRE